MPFQQATAGLIEELHDMSVQDGDQRQMAQRMLELFSKSLSAISGSVAIRSGEHIDELVILAGVELPPGVLGQRIKFGEGVLGQVAASCKPRVFKGEGPGRGAAGERRRGASLCWPLQLKNKLVGVLSLNLGSEAPEFTPESLARTQAPLSLFALLLDNLLMRSEQRQRIDALSKANDELNALNERLGAAQAQLLQSEKMASIGQLAAGVAHEINNPVGYVNANINTLSGYVTELLAAARGREAPNGKPVDLDYLEEDLPQLLSETREGLDRVAKIVRDLKDFSRVDTSDDWEWADLVGGLRGTLNIVNNEVKYKAEVINALEPLPQVQCHPGQMNQVFMNLIVNAAQAIPERGTIRLSCGQANEQVWFEVADNGCGMSEEVRSRIFEPFFTTKPVGKGTGLGLSVSYSIVRKHHGTISVSSTPGQGTTFRIELPIQQPQDAATPAEAGHA